MKNCHWKLSCWTSFWLFHKLKRIPYNFPIVISRTISWEDLAYKGCRGVLCKTNVHLLFSEKERRFHSHFAILAATTYQIMKSNTTPQWCILWACVLACQCNGHSNCTTRRSMQEWISDQSCTQCAHNTTGDHCQYCAEGFYGDPRNGGHCEGYYFPFDLRVDFLVCFLHIWKYHSYENRRCSN